MVCATGYIIGKVVLCSVDVELLRWTERKRDEVCLCRPQKSLTNAAAAVAWKQRASSLLKRSISQFLVIESSVQNFSATDSIVEMLSPLSLIFSTFFLQLQKPALLSLERMKAATVVALDTSYNDIPTTTSPIWLSECAYTMQADSGL